MTFALFLAFLASAIPNYFTPGPNNLMLMTSAAKFGLRRTVPHMLGICIGFPVMVFIVGLGLGEIFEQLPWLKLVLKYAAAAYFLWMAWHLLGLKVGAASSRERPLGFFEAAAFQWINPKAWVMAISFVALVVEPGAGRLTTLLVLTLGCLAIGPFSSALWMLFGQQLEAFLKRTGGERYLGAILAVLMIVAVVLFLL
ncbi:MAG TPA: LysE family translocator [Devosiaceae bacterium]|jgi:threonine/homoserine/homoserine lactone efflux protein